jgi:hypothetical protein
MRDSTKLALFWLTLPLTWAFWLMLLILHGVNYLLDFLLLVPPTRRHRW